MNPGKQLSYWLILALLVGAVYWLTQRVFDHLVRELLSLFLYTRSSRRH